MSYQQCKAMVRTAAISCMTVAAFFPDAYAAAIEEVIVTAQKREENLQTTPIALSVLSGETLEKQGVTSLTGIAKVSPSISFTPYPNSSNLLILYMRGQGVSDPAQITSDGSVGLYQDGFYISRPQAATFDLADIERVEVLRGPQGTLYGRNTTGGAVNLISKKPTGEFGFRQNLTFGSRDEFRSLSVIDLPAWRSLASKFTLLKSSRDGYVRNTGNGHDYGEEEQQAGRLTLRWTPSATFAADYFMEKGELDSTPGLYQNEAWNGMPILTDGVAHVYYDDAGSPRSRTYRPVDLPLSTSEFEAHGLTLSWDASETLTIKSMTGYRTLNWRAYQEFAEAFGYVISVDPVTAIPINFTSDNQVDDHQFSQELQFIGNLVDHRVQYIAGLYYFKEGSSSTGNGLITTFGIPQHKFRYVSADAKSLAAYTQLSWTPPLLNDRLDVTLGMRYTRDDRSAQRSTTVDGVVLESGKSSGTENDQRFNEFNPALTFNFAWTDAVNVYAKVATGYKAGGSSESGPIGQFDQTFSPEKVTTYELGLKSYAWQRRVRLNMAVFESKFDDMQLAFAVDPTDSSVVQSYNAGKATVRGFEAELLVAPTRDINLSLDYAYLDSSIDKVTALPGTIFDPATNPAIAGQYDVGNNVSDLFALPYAPRHKLNLAADYTFFRFNGGSLAAHLDYQFQSPIYTTATAGSAVPGHDYVKIPSYGVLNGRLILELNLPRGDEVQIAVWGRNLTDKEYPVQVVGGGNAIATTGPLGVVGAGYVNAAKIWSEPASFGVDISYRY